MWIGIELTASFIKHGLFDGQRLIHREVTGIHNRESDRLIEQILQILENARNREKVRGIGIAIPAQVDPDHHEILESPALPAIEGTGFLHRIGEQLPVAVTVGSDVQMAAWGEYHFHPEIRQIRAQNVIYIAPEFPFRVGLVLGGRLYTGTLGLAGHLGHFSVSPEGPKCTCGRTGCVQTWITPAGLVTAVQSVLWKYPQSRLRQIRIENLRPEDVFEAARFADRAAMEVMDTSARVLGILLGCLTNMFQPDAILFGGTVFASNDFFVQKAWNHAREIAIPRASRHCVLLHSHLKYFAAVWGAGLLAMQRDATARKSARSSRKTRPRRE